MSNQFLMLTDSALVSTSTILDIIAERKNQRQKWGIQSHGINSWLMILGEEFGEACKSGNESYFREAPLSELRKEVIQVAAVAIAIIEAIGDVK